MISSPSILISSPLRQSFGDGGVNLDTGLAGAEPPKVTVGMSFDSTSSMLLILMRSRAGEAMCFPSRGKGKLLWARSRGRFKSKLWPFTSAWSSAMSLSLCAELLSKDLMSAVGHSLSAGAVLYADMCGELGGERGMKRFPSTIGTFADGRMGGGIFQDNSTSDLTMNECSSQDGAMAGSGGEADARRVAARVKREKERQQTRSDSNPSAGLDAGDRRREGKEGRRARGLKAELSV